MTDRERTPTRIAIFIISIIVGTAVVIAVTSMLTGSWAVSATAGVIAGVLTTAIYPITFPRRP